MTIEKIKLQAQKDRRIRHGHPWVYSNEVVMTSAVKALPRGAIVDFLSHDGAFLGRGSFSAHNLIAGRIFTRAEEDINQAWFVAQFERAMTLRDKMVGAPYYRLIHAEADGLPGLVIDRYNDIFSVQVGSAGMELLWPEIQKALKKLFKPSAIILHNEGASRAHEGLEQEVKVASGKCDDAVEVHENGLIYFADIKGGQKTGWYYDQRDNHALMAKYAKGARVLDLYCHSGGFGQLMAAHGAKSVVGVDASQAVLDLGAKSAKKNKVDKKCVWHRADVFEDLEKRILAGEKYEIVIADPPSFVKAKKDIHSGSKGYRKLARLCGKVVEQGGMLFIATCSHNMPLIDFKAEVARGLHEAGRAGRILHTTFAAPDHPTHPHLAESEYLKGLLIQLD